MSVTDSISTHSDGDHASWLMDLGLDKNPFEPGEQATVVHPSWLTQYQLLQHLVLYSNAVFSVVAEDGCGKTSFLQAFKAFLPNDFHIAIMHGSSGVTEDILKQLIIKRFSLNSIGIDGYDEADFLIGQFYEREQHAVLMIDNAETLSEECLNLLYALVSRQDECSYFHVILCGSLPLSLHLEPVAEHYPDDLSYRFDLPLPNAEEVKSYLKQRLLDSGYEGAFPFSEEMVQHLHHQASGDMVCLNQAAQELFSDVMRKKQKHTPIIQAKPFAIGFASMVCVLFAFVMIRPFVDSSEKQIKRIALPEKEHVTAKELVQKPSATFRFDDADDIVVEAPRDTNEEVLVSEGPSPTPNSIVVATEVKPEPAPVVAQPKVVTPVKPIVTATKPVKAKPAPKPRAVTNKQVKVKQPVGPSMETQLKAIKAARAEVRRKRVVVKDSLLHIPKPKLTQVIRPTGKYTIQLLSSPNLARTKGFVSRHQKDNLALYSKRHQGKNWYTVVLGHYQTRTKAKEAIRRLPKDLQALKPWILPIKQLKPVKTA